MNDQLKKYTQKPRFSIGDVLQAKDGSCTAKVLQILGKVGYFKYEIEFSKEANVSCHVVQFYIESVENRFTLKDSSPIEPICPAIQAWYDSVKNYCD